jgi:hypothetical protein
MVTAVLLLGGYLPVVLVSVGVSVAGSGVIVIVAEGPRVGVLVRVNLAIAVFADSVRTTLASMATAVATGRESCSTENSAAVSPRAR